MFGAYYESLENLRTRMKAAGQASWASDLLAAEKSGSTSGEVLSNTVAVLRRILDSSKLEDFSFRNEVQRAYDQGRGIVDRQRE